MALDLSQVFLAADNNAAVDVIAVNEAVTRGDLLYLVSDALVGVATYDTQQAAAARYVALASAPANGVVAAVVIDDGTRIIIAGTAPTAAYFVLGTGTIGEASEISSAKWIHHVFYGNGTDTLRGTKNAKNQPTLKE